MIINTIKPHKIPERLIYTKGDTSQIFSTKTGIVLGKINTEITTLRDKSFYPNHKGFTSLYIRNLHVKPAFRNSGVGTQLTQFAQYLSKKQGAEGRIHLIAYNPDHPADAPHKFYRKRGFVTTSKKHNELIDFAIEQNIPIPPFLTQGIPMYLKNYWKKIK